MIAVGLYTHPSLCFCSYSHALDYSQQSSQGDPVNISVQWLPISLWSKAEVLTVACESFHRLNLPKCVYIQSIHFIQGSYFVNLSHPKTELANTDPLLLGEIYASIYLSVHISHLGYSHNRWFIPVESIFFILQKRKWDSEALNNLLEAAPPTGVKLEFAFQQLAPKLELFALPWLLHTISTLWSFLFESWNR